MENIVYENKILLALLSFSNLINRTEIFKYENIYTLADVELKYTFNNNMNTTFNNIDIGVEHFKRNSYVRPATQFLLKVRTIKEIDINRLITKYVKDININADLMKTICDDNVTLKSIVETYMIIKDINPFLAQLVLSKQFNVFLNKAMGVKVIAIIPFAKYLHNCNNSNHVYEALIKGLGDFKTFLQHLDSYRKTIDTDNISHRFTGELKHYILLNKVITKKSVFKFFNIDSKTLKKITDELVVRKVLYLEKDGTWIYCINNHLLNNLKIYE